MERIKVPRFYVLYELKHVLTCAAVLTCLCYTWFFYPRDVISTLLATATWLAGWLGVCHMPVSSHPCADT